MGVKVFVMKKWFAFFLLLFSTSIVSNAQFTRYVIRLKNKGGSGFTLANPVAYLSQAAIDRRIKFNIAFDSSDLPVSPAYISQIKNIPNVQFLNASKWLNSVTVFTTDAAAITSISNLSFVLTVSGIAAKMTGRALDDKEETKFEKGITPVPFSAETLQRLEADYYNYGTTSYNEIHLHNGEFLHNMGLRGQQMNIAIIDGGFFHYTSLAAFDSVNAEGRVKDTWDFVSLEASVVEDHPHGMQCFSTIAANIPGQFTGKAPKANFFLYRTEDTNGENAIEEHNWVCGAERADSIGVSVISTSLGYTDFPQSPSLSHTYADMNGNTTMSAIGADLAAKKGLLVFAAVGNDGNNSWHYLSSPSDGDSVIAVGAVTANAVVGGLSSYGPSSDGQIKPDMASVGISALVQNTNNTPGFNTGTSFACPNMAGLGACLWQGFPECNNMKIVRALQQAGNTSMTPDDRVGYGIPDMKKAFAGLLIDFSTASSAVNNCQVTLGWNSKDISAMKYEIERKTTGDATYKKIAVINPQAGIVLTNHSYQFIDSLQNENFGTVSYRIRQVIDSSTAGFTAVYIDTTAINYSTSCLTTISPKESVTVQPNPASGNNVNLVIETDYAVTNMPIAVFDSKGSLVMQVSSSKSAGKKIIALSIDKLSAGKYYIKAMNGQKTIGTAELIKL